LGGGDISSTVVSAFRTIRRVDDDLLDPSRARSSPHALRERRERDRFRSTSWRRAPW
jgi:hypothetical protein